MRDEPPITMKAFYHRREAAGQWLLSSWGWD